MKWILKNKDNIEVFDDFNKAVFVFKEEIYHHMCINRNVFDIYNLPEDIGCHFAYKYDEGTISDDELVAFSRSIMLLDTFNGKYEKIAKTKRYVLKRIKNDINVHSEIDEFEEEAAVSIAVSNNEVNLNLEILKDEPSYLRTNAFIFDNKKREYFFKSHQFINTTTKPEELGKVVDIDLSLRYISEA